MKNRFLFQFEINAQMDISKKQYRSTVGMASMASFAINLRQDNKTTTAALHQRKNIGCAADAQAA